MGPPLPWSYSKLEICNSTKKFPAQHANTSERSTTETSEFGWIRANGGGGKGEEQRRVSRFWTELTVGFQREEESGCNLHFLHPRRAGDRISIPAWVVSTYWYWTQWLGQRWNTEVQQLPSSSCHCQAEKKSHRAWLPPLTRPEVAADHRRSCSSKWWVREHTDGKQKEVFFLSTY